MVVALIAALPSCRQVHETAGPGQSTPSSVPVTASPIDLSTDQPSAIRRHLDAFRSKLSETELQDPEATAEAQQLETIIRTSEEADLPDAIVSVFNSTDKSVEVSGEFYVSEGDGAQGYACMFTDPTGMTTCSGATAIKLPPTLTAEVSRSAAEANGDRVIAHLNLTLTSVAKPSAKGVDHVAIDGTLVDVLPVQSTAICERNFEPDPASTPTINFVELTANTRSVLPMLEFEAFAAGFGGYVPALTVNVGPDGQVIGPRLVGPAVDLAIAQRLADATGLTTHTSSAGPCS